MQLTTLAAKTIDDEADDLSGLSYFLTGRLDVCDTVVVFWGLRDGRYANVRGFRGAVGIAGVNFDSLMAGVPDGRPGVVASQPLIRVFVGPGRDPARAAESIKDRLDGEMARLGYLYFLRTFHRGASPWLVRSDGSHHVQA